MFHTTALRVNTGLRKPMSVAALIREFTFSSPSNIARAIQRIVLAMLFFVVASSGTIALAQTNQATFTLASHTPKRVLDGTAIRLSHYNPDRKLRLALAVQPPHMAEEEQYLTELQTKGSPNFHKFLSAEEWNARFAPSAEDEQKVVDWAQSQGLTVTNRFANRLLVDVEATSGTIEKALGVTINNYQVDDEVDFSNDRDPVLPQSLSGVVSAVLGLNSIERMHGMMDGSGKKKGPDYAPGPVYAVGGSSQGDGDPTKSPFYQSSLPSGPVTSISANGFAEPADIQSSQAYDYAALQALGHCCNPQNNPSGSPPDSSIGIVTWANFADKDVQAFFNYYGLAWNYTRFTIDGETNLVTPPGEECTPGVNGCPTDAIDDEATLDTEWSTASANSYGSSQQTAAVYVYEAANLLYSTFSDLYNFMLNDNHAKVLTTSFDWTDAGFGSTTEMTLVLHPIFNSMVGQGWTLINAAGDNGATAGCSPQTQVFWPAEDPDFVAAGGTQMYLTESGTFSREVAWTGGISSTSCSSNLGGGGGGVSTDFPAPLWQSGLSYEEWSNGTQYVLSNSPGRLLPDFSLNAAGTFQNFYYQGSFEGVGGTSIVSPELAGFFAQENAYLASVGSICGSGGNQACTPIGNPSPFLYAIGENPASVEHYPFYDVTSGCDTNNITQAYPELTYYCATTGYDLATGWGSANMLQLAWALNSEVIPAAGSPSIAFSGPATNTWYNTNQTVNWTVSDSGGSYPSSGVAGFTQGWDSIPADPTSEPHGGSGNSFYSGPQSPNATTGCLAFDAAGCSGGSGQGCHTVQVEAWDNQGQTVNGSYGPLCYDSVNPTVTVSNSSATPASGWWNQPVTFTLSATDPGGSNASGIRQTYYQINNAGCVPGSTGNCSSYSAPVTLSAQGQYTVSYFTVDNAGNYSAESTEAVNIDLSSPVTTASLSGVLYSGTTYETAVGITLSATTSGGSGIAGIYYILDGGATTTYTAGSPIGVSAVGSHTLQYWSVNNAGTTGKTSTLSFSIGSSTTASLSVSPNPSIIGQTVTLTATVTATIAGNTPTGSVTFLNGSTAIGSATLAGGTASITTSSLGLGSHSLTVSYGGAGNLTGSASAAVADVVDENTTTKLSSSSSSAAYGSPVTITATVTSSASGTPTGSVQFFSGTTLLGTVSLSGSSAALTTTALAAGHDSITAVYSGDSTYTTSTSSALAEMITSAATTTTVGSSLSPSAYEQPVTFTATVTSTGGIPTGSVIFKSGSTSLGSGTLNGSGQATFTTTKLPVGADSITASYGGVAGFSASSSAAITQVVNADATTTTISSSLNPATYGKAVVFTATVTSTVAGATPTGSVTFMNGTSTLGTGTLNLSGAATLSTSALPVGTSSVSASYAGMTGFIGSSSGSLSQVVNTAASSIKIASSLNPAIYNEPVTFTATVTSTEGTPAGSVTFMAGSTPLGTETLNGSGVATLTTSALPVGTDSIVATYGGDTDLGSNSATLNQVVKTAATTTTLGSSLNPSAYGQPVTLTATVTSAAGTPTGTVTFEWGSTILGTGTLGGSGTATFATMAIAVGARSITAVYGGATDFSDSTSAAVSQTVNADVTTTTLTSTLNPSAYGQPVTLSATVTSAVAGTTPTGTVTFMNGTTALGRGTLSGGVATFTTSALAVGTGSITASYAAVTDFSASSSAALPQVVNADATTTTTNSSLNPSAYGQPVTLSATVTSAVAGTTPTGTVTFMNGTTALGTGTLIGGVATFTTKTLPVGVYSITANYAGVTDFSGSSSAAQAGQTALPQVVNPDATTTTVTSSLSPSASGQSVKFTATVTSAISGATPTGSVTFMNGSTVLGTGTLSGAVATFTTAALPVGTNSITANYGGVTDFNGSTSAAISEVVKTAATTTTVSSSLSLSAYGQPVTFTATVTSAAGTPTGTVTFWSGSTVLGTGTLAGSGTATLTTTQMAVGNDSVTAVYGGATDFSSSRSAAIPQAVDADVTTTTLTSPLNPSAYKQPVTLMATVTSAVAGTTPTGGVTFMNGTSVLGTGTLSGGVATFTTSVLAVGTESITASYAGVTDFIASSSAALPQVVNPDATTTTVTSSLSSSVSGQSVKFTATVASAVAGTTPTGSVTFMNGTSVLGTGTLNGSGVATFTTSALPVGTYSITASYAGVTDFSGSSSAALPQVVNADATTTTVTSSLSPSVSGQSVKFTAKVTSAVSGTTPTGSVTFMNGTSVLGTGTLSGGVATFSTTALPVGTDSITASYAGVTNFSGSSSAAISQVVSANN